MRRREPHWGPAAIVVVFTQGYAAVATQNARTHAPPPPPRAGTGVSPRRALRRTAGPRPGARGVHAARARDERGVTQPVAERRVREGGSGDAVRARRAGGVECAGPFAAQLRPSSQRRVRGLGGAHALRRRGGIEHEPSVARAARAVALVESHINHSKEKHRPTPRSVSLLLSSARMPRPARPRESPARAFERKHAGCWPVGHLAGWRGPSGFSSRSTAREVVKGAGLEALRGRVAVVTGANSGVGFRAARACALRGRRGGHPRVSRPRRRRRGGARHPGRGRG